MADRERAARAIEEFLRALGYSLEGELVGTGERVAAAWIDELLSGQNVDPVAVLRAGSLEAGPGDHGPVVLRGLTVATMCPHHLLPSSGYAIVGYQPRKKIAGLGVIAQALDACARRLTLQETLGETVANALVAGLDAEGAFCRLTLAHSCFTTRGERQAASIVDTLGLSGSYARDDRATAVSLALAPYSQAPNPA